MRTKLALLSLIGLFLVTSCSKEGDFKLTGKINGLKKGTIYLQKIEDTTLVTLDSLVVDGNSEFEFIADLKEPQIVYLTLEKVDAYEYDDRIIIFAEPGEMTLNTSLKNFESQAAITGSENQLKLDEYTKIIHRFNDQNLDLIKKSFEVRKDAVEDSILYYDNQLQNLTKRKYLYTVNFAISNKDYEVAPYLAVSEIFDANVKYLDTIYNSLKPKIKKSKYGSALKDYIKERKTAEKEMVTTVTDTTYTEE
ncbi:DUF4369 domain-containing protein [Leeuwenhoekiella marinoflava]|uniref:DUF4369 domain-containing protein n=2 Tax=Leeuwenhoekiella marinoflava TaxID=988 RepID=A0A4V1KRS5_9FLAO|nr:DUF4369 domain-containing protein [Leeuwenhoekiella marinoflava]RXG25932.1 putative protein DUF4369 [Leeuwenhoekiella marinoflava]SHF73415.1 protein of unknown function [Leeuwenhoekiella marinoflava DSM 3653]